MLRPFSQIQIQQIPTPLWPNRKLNFILDFVTEYTIESGWETHTNNCTVKFPKNIKLFGTPDGVFANQACYNLILSGSGTSGSPNVNAFGQDNTLAPLIMKGDIITINDGYIFRNSKDVDNFVSTGGIFPNVLPPNAPITQNNAISTTINRFQGYVSSVGSDTPIELKCEDNFYLLKRTPFDKTVWNKTEAPSGNTSLYSMMQHILDLTNAAFYSNPKFTTFQGTDVNTGQFITSNPYPFLTLLDIPTSITAQFSLGYLEIGDMTCGELLNKLKQQYHFESTFRGNVLQFGFPIYIDGELPSNQQLQANSNNFFCFRDIYNPNGNNLVASANIFPSHDLEYSNKDDIVLSATVQCKVINSVPGKSTLSGKQKTKVEKLKVLVYWDIVTGTFKHFNLSQGQPTTKVPLNPDGGERHEFWYPVDNTDPNPSIADLVRLGTDHLRRYHYTGFKGCFTTFGFPFVQWNDNINILDPIYSDRNGQYKVKKVIYRGGLKGLSQEIHLDYKINVPIPTSVNQIYML